MNGIQGVEPELEGGAERVAALEARPGKLARTVAEGKSEWGTRAGPPAAMASTIPSST